jgi:hypothetical protein
VLIETYHSMPFRSAGWTRTPSLVHSPVASSCDCLWQSNQLNELQIIFLIIPVLIALVVTKNQQNQFFLIVSNLYLTLSSWLNSLSVPHFPNIPAVATETLVTLF